MFFVCYGWSEYVQVYFYFDFDNEGFGYLGIEKLYILGWIEIVMLVLFKEYSYVMYMIKGVLWVVEKFGVFLIIFDDISSDDGIVVVCEKFVVKLFGGLLFDGIMCGLILFVIGVVVVLEDYGKVVGMDFDVIGKEVMLFLILFCCEIIVM